MDLLINRDNIYNIKLFNSMGNCDCNDIYWSDLTFSDNNNDIMLKNKKFIFESGLTYNYNYNVTSNFVEFNGSYLHTNSESYFKNISQGFSLNIDIEKYDYSGNTLNNLIPNNEGFFYYIGLKNENLVCYSGETFEINELHSDPSVDSFIYFQNNGTQEKFTTVKNIDCCDNINNNTLGFRITNDGKIGYRTIVNGVVHEKYSKAGIISDNKRHNIIISVSPQIINRCDIPTIGIIEIYVDKFLIFKDKNFPYVIPHNFDSEYQNLNSGVSFNISIGGGTKGMIDDPAFLDEPIEEEYYYYAIPNSIINNVNDNYFSGMTVDNIFYPYDYNISLISYLNGIFIDTLEPVFIKSGYCNIGNIIPYTKKIINNLIHYTNPKLIETCCVNNEDLLLQENTLQPVKKLTLKLSEKCRLIEYNFSGVFIGKIYSFKVSDNVVKYNDLKCL